MQTPAPAPRPGASRCDSGRSCKVPKWGGGWVQARHPLSSCGCLQSCRCGCSCAPSQQVRTPRHPGAHAAAATTPPAAALTTRPGWWPQSAAPSRSRQARWRCPAAAASARADPWRRRSPPPGAFRGPSPRTSGRAGAAGARLGGQEGRDGRQTLRQASGRCHTATFCVPSNNLLGSTL